MAVSLRFTEGGRSDTLMISIVATTHLQGARTFEHVGSYDLARHRIVSLDSDRLRDWTGDINIGVEHLEQMEREFHERKIREKSSS
jgi:hypothetical protein